MEQQVLEAIDRLHMSGHGFPLSLSEVQNASSLPASKFVQALRSLRASGDVKVLDGKVTFAVNAYLYKQQ